MAMPRKLIEAQEAEIVQRYTNGEPLSALGAAYGVSPATIRNILMRHNVERRSRGAEKQFTDEERKERDRQACKRWYEGQKEQGLCTHCGTGIPVPGTTSCETCTETAQLAKRRRTEAGYGKQWYEGKKQQGLCVCCGVTPVIPGRAYCELCAEKQRQKSKRLREKRKADGLCISCGGPTELGVAVCSDCRRYGTVWYEERKESGLCLRCTNVAEPGKKLCADCFENLSADNKSRYQERRQQGLCIACGNTAIPGRVYCQECRGDYLARERELNQQCLENGLCLRCHKSQAVTLRKLCIPCYLKTVSSRHFHKVGLWQQLQELFDRQNGRCALSGVKLTLGTDAELDHIVPRSKGGSNDLTNVQWVHAGINRLKDRMPEQELRQVIEALYNAMNKG